MANDDRQAVKVVIITPEGELGPFTPAQINRMFAEGRINGDQLCRVDDATTPQPLKERFRHMAPDQAVAAGAKAKVEAYVQRERSKSAIVLGTFSVIAGVLSLMNGRIVRGVFLTAFGAVVLASQYLKNGKAVPAQHTELSSERPEVPGKTYEY